jgi:hypothetical protein
MNGPWVPLHFAVSMEPMKAQALAKLLRDMNDDEAFVLNELEQELVDELVRLIEDGDPTAVHS